MSWRFDADLNPGDGSSFSAARKSEALSSSDLRAFAVRVLGAGRLAALADLAVQISEPRCDES
jgi:hypothetical protein